MGRVRQWLAASESFEVGSWIERKVCKLHIGITRRMISEGLFLRVLWILICRIRFYFAFVFSCEMQDWV